MISQEYIKSILLYDPETGIFTWKERPLSMFRSEVFQKIWNTRYAGKTAGNKSISGYVYIGISEPRKRQILAHRLAWLCMTGNLPKIWIDHIDRIKHNNAWSNLRESNQSQNNCNRLLNKNNTSGFKGVSYSKCNKKWTASINYDGITKRLGLFKTAEEASKAYNEQSLLHHKEFSYLNNIYGE